MLPKPIREHALWLFMQGFTMHSLSFHACPALKDVFDLLSFPIPESNLQTYRPFSSQACKGKEHCGINQTIDMNDIHER